MTQNLHNRIVAFAISLALFCSLSIEKQSHGGTWDFGSAPDMRWTTATNWDDDASPANKHITFDGTTTAASGVTSIVDDNLTITTLLARYDVASAQHTVQIDATKTLTINGSRALSAITPGFTPTPVNGNVGFAAISQANTSDLNLNFTGGGKLHVNSPANMFLVSNTESSRYAIVDMSTLDFFEANVANFRVGHSFAGNGGTANLVRGRLFLAQDNKITASTFELGTRDKDSTTIGEVYLGETNVINANTIELGRVKGTGTLAMQTGLTNPTVTIRNTAGTGAVNNMSIGFFNVASNAAGSFGSVDLKGADVDALITNLNMGVHNTGVSAAAATGSFDFNKGTVTVTTALLGQTNGNNPTEGKFLVSGTGVLNATTMTLGRRGANSGGARGILTLDGSAVANVTTLRMGDQTQNSGNPVEGYVDLLGNSTLRAMTINKGLGAGTGSATRRINFSSGTIQNLAGTDLTITPDITIRLATTGTHALKADSGRTITYNGVATELAPGASGLTFNGAGTVFLGGASTFTGTSTLVSGTLTGNGSLAGNLDVTGGRFAPGINEGTFTIGGGTLGSGGTLAIELGGTTAGTEYDQLLSGGNIALGGTLEISLTDGFLPNFADQFIVVDAATISGKFANVNVLNGLGYFDVIYNSGTGQVILTNYQIPEPSSVSLIALGLVGLVFRRRVPCP